MMRTLDVLKLMTFYNTNFPKHFQQFHVLGETCVVEYQKVVLRYRLVKMKLKKQLTTDFSPHLC